MGNCCDTRVLPVHTTETPSSSVEEKHPKSSSKDAEQPQAQASMSREKPEVVQENADTAPSAGEQGEPPVGMEKVATQKRRRIFSILRGICQNTTVTPQDTERPSTSEPPSIKTTEMKTKDIPEQTDNTIAPDVNKNKTEAVESEEARKPRRISELLKRIELKQTMGPQYGIGIQTFGVTSPETTVKNEKEYATAPLPVEENTSGSMTEVEPIRFKCFSSLLNRFYQKGPSRSQVREKPPVHQSTSEDTLVRTSRRGTENIPDIKQIFCREEEFESHDEGSWEEYKSYFPGGVHVPESKLTMDSTMVESYIAKEGDTDVEQQQKDLDSKETFPDVIEVQQWELRKVSSTVAPEVDTLFLAPTTSSEERLERSGGSTTTN